MQSRIVGSTMPALELLLEPGESVISEAGELSWMSQSIAMTTHTQFGGGGGFREALEGEAPARPLLRRDQSVAGQVRSAPRQSRELPHLGQQRSGIDAGCVSRPTGKATS